MKNFITKLEWYEDKVCNNNKYGLSLWRLSDFNAAICLVSGSKREEDYVPNPELSESDLEKIVVLHITDYAARLRRIGFIEGSYHGKKITRSGAIGAATVLDLSPLDFWYMAHIDKIDPGEEFWRAVDYFNEIEINFA